MILILDNYKQSLLIFKSLHELNIPFIVGSTSTLDPWTFSKYCSEVWTHPSFSSELLFKEHLLAFLDNRKDIRAIYPIGELALIALSSISNYLPDSITLFMPKVDIINLCLNKKKCSEMISELNIPYANSTLIGSHSELKTLARSCGYPVIFKPNYTVNSLKTEKAIIVENEKNLYLVQTQWDQKNSILMEKYIKGERVSINLVVLNGEIINFLQNLILQTQEIDGTGFTVRTCSMMPSMVLKEYVKKIVKHIEYTGVINIQFILNQQDNKYYFIEINPRMPATTALIYKTGIDLADYVLHIYGYQKNKGIKKQIYGVEGVTCNWFYGDLVAYIKHLFNGEYNFLSAIKAVYLLFKSAFTSDIDQLWYFNDVKPGIISFIRPFFSWSFNKK